MMLTTILVALATVTPALSLPSLARDNEPVQVSYNSMYGERDRRLDTTACSNGPQTECYETLADVTPISPSWGACQD